MGIPFLSFQFRSNVICSFLNKSFPSRVIGRRDSIEWPSQFLNLTLMDFFLWGTSKDEVYAEMPTNVNQL